MVEEDDIIFPMSSCSLDHSEQVFLVDGIVTLRGLRQMSIPRDRAGDDKGLEIDGHPPTCYPERLKCFNSDAQ
jgi:hypothetical protein